MFGYSGLWNLGALVGGPVVEGGGPGLGWETPGSQKAWHSWWEFGLEGPEA